MSLTTLLRLESDVPIPIKHALLTLDLACLVRDVSVTLATLFVEFVCPIGEKNPIAEKPLFGRITENLKLYKDMLQLLDEALEGDAALALDKAGYILWQPLSTMREWRRVLAKVGVALQGLVVKEFVRHLEVAVDACRAACPMWKACLDVEGDRFDVSLAGKMLIGKMPKVVAAHNQVHKVLASMSQSAASLHVVPRLQDNELSKPAVHVALNTLADTATASVVVLGVEMLHKYSQLPNGPQAAKTFLDTHFEKEGKNIDKSFWQEVRNLANHAVGDLKSPPGKKPRSSASSGSGTKLSAPHSCHAQETPNQPRAGAEKAAGKSLAVSVEAKREDQRGLKRVRRS